MGNELSSMRKVFGNSAWMITSKMLNIIIGLIVSIYVTRYLGPEQKGVMANAAAITGFFGFLASFGLLDILISKFTKERENSATIAATGMSIMLCGGIVAIILCLISAIALGVDRDVLIYVVIDSLVYLFHCLNIYEYWFYSNSKTKTYAIAQFIIHLIFLIIRFLGIPLKAHLSYFIIVAALETAIIYSSSIICYKLIKIPFIGKFRFDWTVGKMLIRLAIPMVAMGFATSVYMKVDQIMVGKLIGNTELGLYSVAVTLAEYWYFIPTTIYSSFLPVLSERYLSGDDFLKSLQQFADIMTIIGYCAIAVVSMFGHWVINLLYGDAFSGAANILIVYIWSGLFTCLSLSGQAYYIMRNDTKTVMWINLSGAGINFVLNILLICIFGSIGAAVATLLQYVVVAFGQMLIMRKRYGELYTIQLKAMLPFVRVIKYICHKNIF